LAWQFRGRLGLPVVLAWLAEAENCRFYLFAAIRTATHRKGWEVSMNGAYPQFKTAYTHEELVWVEGSSAFRNPSEDVRDGLVARRNQRRVHLLATEERLAASLPLPPLTAFAIA
jgi:hypothetical protein